MPTESPAKQPCFLRSASSRAFTQFCERVYGKMLNQYGTADMEQLDLLLQVLQLKRGAAVLDAGCGTGFTTVYLAERSAARFTGIDKSESSIALARKVKSTCEFLVGDMDDINLAPGSFDAVIAIEALYFPRDLAATIGRFKAALKPGGRMGFFYTHIDPTGASAAPGATKLGLALAANGLEFESHDLTESDRRFWQRSKDAAEELRTEFEAEDNFDLVHAGETAAVLDLIAKGGHARYLYHVRLP